MYVITTNSDSLPILVLKGDREVIVWYSIINMADASLCYFTYSFSRQNAASTNKGGGEMSVRTALNTTTLAAIVKK